MRSRTLAYAFCLIGGFLWSRQAWSQQMEFRPAKSDSVKPGGDSVRIVNILSTDSYRFEQKDSATSFLFLVGHVILKEGKTIIYCDSMVRNSQENTIQSYGHVRIFDGDSTNIYSDYMKYEVFKRNVFFQNNVKLTDGKGVLTTNELQYDLNQKVGVYLHGGKVVNNGSILTSEEATYYEGTKDVYFRKKVLLKDPQYDLKADSLLYNTQSQISTFITETYIVFKDSTHRTVRTKEGFYDLRNRKAQFGRRPVITDGSQQITGEHVQFDDSTGISTATGNAIYRDTAQGVSIHANYMISNKKKKTFLATDKPLLILKQDNDSIYIRADSFYSGSLLDPDTLAAPPVPKQAGQKALPPSTSKDSLYAKDSLRAHAPLQDSLHRTAEDDSTEASLPDSLHKRIPDRLRNSAPDTALHSHMEDLRTRDSVRTVPPDSLHTRPPDSARKELLNARQTAARNNASPALREGLLKKDNPFNTASDTLHIGTRDSSARKSVPDSTRRLLHDTVITATPTDSSLRFIKGYHNVRIFSDSLQAVGDSLYYSGKDSIFRLFKDPIAWGNGNYQVTGDTMYIYTKNKKAERLYVFENALALNKVGPNFYNQLKGVTINAYLKDGVMDFMRSKGNAECIYYVKDDSSAYTGVNKSHADIIDMLFKNKELDKVIFRSDVEGSMIPFKQVKFDEMRLRGFKWQEALRPKSKEELLEEK